MREKKEKAQQKGAVYKAKLTAGAKRNLILLFITIIHLFIS